MPYQYKHYPDPLSIPREDGDISCRNSYTPIGRLVALGAVVLGKIGQVKGTRDRKGG